MERSTEQFIIALCVMLLRERLEGHRRVLRVCFRVIFVLAAFLAMLGVRFATYVIAHQ